MTFFVFLPLFAFLFILVFLFKKNLLGFRAAFIFSSLLWTLAAVAIVEILSLFQALTRELVTGCWVLVILGALFSFKGILGIQRTKTVPAEKFSVLEWVLFFTIFLVLVITGVTAIVAAPNNWDSMTYHLPRVMHWIQNQSVAHYPTHILRQLYQPPGSEFLILHFQILVGNDRFVNMVQWFSLLGSIITVSLIAAELGASRLGQILSGFITAVIPMAVLQSSSTQNDLIAGFWLSAAVYFLIRLLKNEAGFFDRAGAGCTLGLALLTKGTIYVFLLPWLGAFFLYSFLKRRKYFLRDLIVIAVCCLLINIGHYVRNVQTFGKPLSSGSEHYTNEGDLAGALISNPVRNLSVHLSMPFPAVNQAFKDGLNGFHQRISSRPAEATTWGEFDVPHFWAHEDITGNPFHVLLGFVILFFIFLKKENGRPVKSYAVLLIASYLLFCLIFKWQMFHSRLHLPLFILGAPLLGMVLSRIKQKEIIFVVIAVLMLTAVPSLFYNERRPLVGKKNIFNTSREEQYFSYRRFMLLPYVLTAKYTATRGWDKIGFVFGGDDWEYPLWVFLKNVNPAIEIRNVNVKNESRKLVSRQESPPALISQSEAPPDVIVADQVPYFRGQRISFISFYENIRP